MVDLFLFLLVWGTRASNPSFAKGKLTGDVMEFVCELRNLSEFIFELLIKLPFLAPFFCLCVVFTWIGNGTVFRQAFKLQAKNDYQSFS